MCMACRGAETRTPDVTFTFVACAVHLHKNKTLLTNDNIYAILWLTCYNKVFKHYHPLVEPTVLPFSSQLSFRHQTYDDCCVSSSYWVQVFRSSSLSCVKISPFVAPCYPRPLMLVSCCASSWPKWQHLTKKSCLAQNTTENRSLRIIRKHFSFWDWLL